VTRNGPLFTCVGACGRHVNAYTCISDDRGMDLCDKCNENLDSQLKNSLGITIVYISFRIEVLSREGLFMRQKIYEDVAEWIPTKI
jgi:hypothetical protein